MLDPDQDHDQDLSLFQDPYQEEIKKTNKIGPKIKEKD